MSSTEKLRVAIVFVPIALTFAAAALVVVDRVYRVGPTAFYVSRGIGMEGGNAPRVRLFARPEIAVLDLVPNQPAP